MQLNAIKYLYTGRFKHVGGVVFVSYGVGIFNRALLQREFFHCFNCGLRATGWLACPCRNSKVIVVIRPSQAAVCDSLWGTTLKVPHCRSSKKAFRYISLSGIDSPDLTVCFR